ncbi:MAG: class I SAM-dependent methyltransferase [Candidatus Aminicenantes bacterium]|nr:class I SAM-dependent methyltransferase [Candidatus Aminicenantes bacterium]
MIEQKTRFDFGPAADRYDEWYESREGERFDMLEKAAVSRLLNHKPQAGKLLEVGSGTGWWSDFFARMGFHVTGVDISPDMVGVAQKKAIAGATFLRADAHDLPFVNGCFDVSAAITSLEFAAEPEFVVGEMIRCTRRDGKLILGVLNAQSAYNRLRGNQYGSPFAVARLFSLRELNPLLAPLGRVRVIPCAFPFSLGWPLAVGKRLDVIQQRLGCVNGAFLAVEVNLCGSRLN